MNNGLCIVLTNDDGFDAPGLHAAYNAVRELGTVHVVAPNVERSACSHTITLRRPIVVERLTLPHFGEIFIVSGTPADCVRLAYAELIDGPIDLVVSGINRGANAGVDVFYSGTVAGAREGAILGLRSVAVSQAVRGGIEPDWIRVSSLTDQLIRGLLNESLPGPGFWNINLPSPLPPPGTMNVHRVPTALHPVPMKFDRVESEGGRILEFTYGAAYWDRIESGPTDYTVIRDGGIAVSAVSLNGRF